VTDLECLADDASVSHPKPPADTAKPPAADATPITGAGQTVGLVEFDSFVQSDVVNYLSLLNMPPTLINNLSKVDVNGGVAPGDEQPEVLLDIGAILTLAPGAKVAVYDAPFSGAGSFEPILNQMINDKVTIMQQLGVLRRSGDPD